LKTRIGGIRGFLTKLEFSYDSMSKHQFDKELDEIVKLIDILRDEASHYYKEKSFDQYSIGELEQDDDSDRGVVYSVINSIPFLVKNVETEDIYEDNYLVNFCEERTRELMKGRAINTHNEFWKQHQTVAGNVYGSVPSELLRTENIEILKDYKWIEKSVDIIDFKISGYSKDRILKYVSENFRSYIIVDEIRTSSLLVLRYNDI
jgi:hypothetical protein